MLLSALGVVALPSIAYAASSLPAQLYLSPSTVSTARPIALSAHQVNSVLAHHLGVSAYEPLPISNGDKAWEETLTTGGWGAQDKLVIILECDAQGCQGAPFPCPGRPVQCADGCMQ